MTPKLLSEYVFYVGLAITVLFWINMGLFAIVGAFDKENKE